MAAISSVGAACVGLVVAVGVVSGGAKNDPQVLAFHECVERAAQAVYSRHGGNPPMSSLGARNMAVEHGFEVCDPEDSAVQSPGWIVIRLRIKQEIMSRLK